LFTFHSASASALAMTRDKRRRDVESRHGTQEEVRWEGQKMTKQQAKKGGTLGHHFISLPKNYRQFSD